MDIFYALYTLSITNKFAYRSATYASIIYLFAAFGTINIVDNHYNIIPAVLGSWLGTFVVIKYDKNY